MREALRTLAFAAGVGAAGLAGVLGLLVALIFLSGGFGDRGLIGPPAAPRPVVFEVRVPRGATVVAPQELHLVATDAAALGVVSPVRSPDGAALRIETTWTELVWDRAAYCLTGEARALTPSTGAVDAVIPAGTCLSETTLQVPTPAMPAFAAELEHDEFGPVPSNKDVVALTGVLTVGIDGCTTMDGALLRWPSRTEIDETGAVRLPDGSSLANGSTVTLPVVRRPRDPTATTSMPRWCVGDDLAHVASPRS